MNYEASRTALSNDPRMSQMSQAFLLQKKNTNKIIKAIKYMDSSDPAVVVKGLNILTQKTYELYDSNALQLENFPELILSLGSLMDIVNRLDVDIFSNSPHNSYSSMVLDRSNTYWSTEIFVSPITELHRVGFNVFYLHIL